MERLDSHARIGAAQVSEHKFQNPASLLCMFYATVVLLKWRHGPHHHVSRVAQGVRNPAEYGRGGDTENRMEVGGRHCGGNRRHCALLLSKSHLMQD